MLEMVIWDVDHGSAAYIKTPAGKHIAIDLGVGDMSAGQREFSPLQHLRDKYGIRQLDWLIITHPHRDHIDDIGNVSLVRPKLVYANRSIPAEFINRGNQARDADIIRQYNSLLSAYSGPILISDGPSYANGWGCDILQFTPNYAGPNLNNYSLVTVIRYAGTKIVIPGDNEGPSWKSLLENPFFVQAIKGTDIFVASHHGRESGFYGELFEHFKPSLVLISDTNHGDTSVTSNYHYHTTGWQVDSRRKGSRENRRCLSTRNDGCITIKCHVGTNGQNYRDVSTEL